MVVSPRAQRIEDTGPAPHHLLSSTTWPDVGWQESCLPAASVADCNPVHEILTIKCYCTLCGPSLFPWQEATWNTPLSICILCSGGVKW